MISRVLLGCVSLADWPGGRPAAFGYLATICSGALSFLAPLCSSVGHETPSPRASELSGDPGSSRQTRHAYVRNSVTVSALMGTVDHDRVAVMVRSFRILSRSGERP